MEHTQDLFDKEQVTFKEACEKNPEACVSVQRLDYQAALKHIGIFKDVTKLPEGYLNLFQQDFLVEEITAQNTYVSLALGQTEIPNQPTPEERTLYATLIKANMSTFDAVANLANALKIDSKQISFAGIKDAMAITSQQIAFRDVPADRFTNLSIPGITLHSFHWGKGILEKGKQQGNHFTITIRTNGMVAEDMLHKAIQELEEGFYNYYFFQRFGTPRLISHVLGKYLLRRNYADAVKIFFCEKGAAYQPIIADIRNQALVEFGNWEKIKTLFKPFPYTFRRELVMLSYLEKNPEDFLGALKTQDEQPLFWIYAYASYLFNGYISDARAKGEHIPPVVPLLLNPKYKDNGFYMSQLNSDGISKLQDALRDITGYSPLSEKNVCVSKIRAKNIKSKIIDTAVIVSFDLPPGAYATTFLSNLFQLMRSEPRPDWVNTNRIDSKALLGEESLEAIEKRFADTLRSEKDLS